MLSKLYDVAASLRRQNCSSLVGLLAVCETNVSSTAAAVPVVAYRVVEEWLRACRYNVLLGCVKPPR